MHFAPAPLRSQPPLLRLLPVLLLAAFLGLTGCSGSDDSNGNYAEIRLLNVSPDYNSLDLYVNNASGDTDSMKFEGVTYETVSGYDRVNSTTYTVKLKRNGVTSTLSTVSDEKQADDTHVTYVAYGSTGNFGILKINDDQTAANSGKTKLQVLNTAEAGALDIYLTDASVALDDATPQFTVAAGAASAVVYFDSATYRLRVVGTGDTTDLRLDVPSLTLDSTKMDSLILTGTEGGVLVNALLLPQREALVVNHNTKSRIRGAVAISNGTSVTAGIGGTTLLTGAGVGVISGRYTLVEAGTAAVNLKVDGVAIPMDTETLIAGTDYTMLFWSNASGTQMTLAMDDNHPSTSGKAKFRLLNGLSTQASPVTVALDFSPIVEGVAVGSASDYTEFDAGSDYQFDVSDTNTAAALLTKSSVTLAASGVYTLFISGTPTVSGTLRKDH